MISELKAGESLVSDLDAGEKRVKVTLSNGLKAHGVFYCNFHHHQHVLKEYSLKRLEIPAEREKVYIIAW